LFSSFDPPEVMTSCARRRQTIVPTQALALLNGPLPIELATAFARRIVDETGSDLERNAARAWIVAYGRPITRDESKRASEFFATTLKAGRPRNSDSPSWASRQPARSLEGATEEPATPHERALAELCLALFNSNEFAFVD
jgi:hypothetical protein